MYSLSSYKQRERRECGDSRRFYRLNVYATNLYPPTGALDSKASRMLLDCFTQMNRELGATILMVTHDAFTASYASRILFIKDGGIFSETRKGEEDRKSFFNQIIDVVTLLGGDLDDAV